jgi:hypothetical protein
MRNVNQRTIIGYYQDILLAIFVFMLRDKKRRQDVRQLVERQLAEAQALIDHGLPRKGGNSTVLGAVLHEWYRNAAYLTRSAVPKPISLLGRRPSVVSLVRAQEKAVDARQVAKEMVQLRLIRRTPKGKYLPVSRVATIRELTPASIEHVSKSLERLLATVNFNTRSRGRSKSLIERTAFVQDLPSEEIQSFRAFAQEQGSAFLANADEWLESRRIPKRRQARSKAVRAGIHVYAFEERSHYGTTPPPRRLA